MNRRIAAFALAAAGLGATIVYGGNLAVERVTGPPERCALMNSAADEWAHWYDRRIDDGKGKLSPEEQQLGESIMDIRRKACRN